MCINKIKIKLMHKLFRFGNFPPTKEMLGITRHINLVEKIMNFTPILKVSFIKGEYVGLYLC